MADTGMSKQDLQDILRQQQEGFVKVIAEIRKPDPLTEAKMKREAELADRARVTRLNSLIEQQKSREAAQAKCPHRKNNGDPQAGSAIHHPPMNSDGMVHPLCVECGKEFEPYRPSMMEMSGMVG